MKVLQGPGSHTLSDRTRKALNLTPSEAKQAIEGLKESIGQGNADHGHKILSNGVILDAQTNERLGDLFDFIHKKG